MPAPTPSMTPPTKGGSGALLGAIIVMLLLMGGLIFWKFSGDDKKPEPPPTPSVAKTAEEPVFEEPPPPPPPPKEEDAGKTTVAKGGKGGGRYSGPNPCAKKECKGKMTSTLQSALRGRAGQSRRCYERALLQNATLQGRMTVSVRISPTGGVCSAGVASNSLGDPAVANCVVGVFRSGTFPAPQGGCIDTAVPINFVPRKN